MTTARWSAVLVLASILQVAPSRPAAAGTFLHDLKLQRQHGRTKSGSFPLPHLGEFQSPFRALAAALTRKAFRAGLAQTGGLVLGSHDTLVENRSGFSAHREKLYAKSTLSVGSDGTLRLSRRYYSIISAAFDAPGVAPRRYERPQYNSDTTISGLWKNAWFGGLFTGGLEAEFGGKLTTNDVVAAVRRLEGHQ